MIASASLAWLLVALCLWRAEHVWASNVWIARSGEHFKEREAQEVASNQELLLAAGQEAAWRDALLTPEQRWSLYIETGGSGPWLCLGIRSHRLLVAARRAGKIKRSFLTLIRLLWLNWAFPIWIGVILVWLAATSNRDIRLPIIVAAACLCVNTAGAMVGGSFSAITMGGLSRHHDSWKLQDTANARAIAEFGYSTVAAALFFLSCGLFVQVFSAESITSPNHARLSVASLAASLNFVLQGSAGDTLHLSSQWIAALTLGAHLATFATAVAWTIAVASAGRMWLRSAS